MTEETQGTLARRITREERPAAAESEGGVCSTSSTGRERGTTVDFSGGHLGTVQD